MGGKKKTLSDFKIIKKKVGKKAKPANETSTKFQSKQLVIREQSVVSNLTSEESTVSSRGLTVDQLLCQTRHHNPKIRKEAFVQILEIATGKLNSPLVRKSFALCLEGLADSGMRDLDQEVRLCFQQLLDVLLSQNFAFTSSHLSTMTNLLFVCITERGSLDRRLDATKVLIQLVSFSPTFLSFEVQHKLVPLYTDLCRCVLGTTSSSRKDNLTLTKPAVVGKILETMKREEKLEQMKKKLKRSKAKESNIKKLEYSLVHKRMVSVANAVLHLSTRLQVVDDTQALLVSVLELFRHTLEIDLPPAFVPCAESLSKLLHIDHNNTPELRSRVQDAFSSQHDNMSLFALRRCEVLCCFQNEMEFDDAWSHHCLRWFLSNDLAQKDEELNCVLFGMLNRFPPSSRDALCQCFTSRITTQCLDTKEWMWRLSLVEKTLLETVSATFRLQWIQGLPQVLWNDAKLRTAGFSLLRKCALMEEDFNRVEWITLAKHLSLFYSSTHSQTKLRVLGPFVLDMESHERMQLLSVIFALPLDTLPPLLLKSWSHVAMAMNKSKDVELLIETSFAFFKSRAIRNNGGGLDSLLSFALTVGLLTPPYVTLVCRELTSLYDVMGIPIFALLAPHVLAAFDGKPSGAWLEMAACVLACGDIKQEGFDTLQQALGKALVSTGSWSTHLRVFASLVHVLSPLEIFHINGQENDLVVERWVEFLLHSEGNHHAWWSMEGNPELWLVANQVALTNPRVASNVKLLSPL